MQLRWSAKILLIGIIILLSTTIGFCESTVNIVVDGEEVEFTEKSGFPFVEEGKSYVPLRVVLEAFGAKVTWNDEKGMVEATKGNITMGIPIGEAYIIKNEETIVFDKKARLVNGRSYLPIRKVMESFGCEVSWDGQTESVKIESGEYIEAIKEFEDVIIFENDIRLFTMYAFMNFTGYDDENNSKGFHEVRKMVRDDLDKMGLELKDNNFYRNKGIGYSDYNNTIKKLGNAPEFTVLKPIEDYEVVGANIYLKEFYEKANIEELYKKYEPYYEEELKRYKSKVYKALYNTNDFLDIETPASKFYIRINLLESYWRGSGLGSIDELKKAPIITTGPSYEPNTLNIVHEYLHGVINPIIDDMGSVIKKTEYMMEDIKDSDAVMNQNYNKWRSIVIESIIRALANKIVEYDDIQRYKKVQTNDGFILTNYFYNAFSSNEYLDYEGTLEEFIKNKLIELEGVQVEELLKEANS